MNGMPSSQAQPAEKPHCVGVLIVEDDREIRHTLRDLLREEGYQVEEAANGREALALLKRFRLAGERLPCMILLDLMMPVMDGWQFREAQVQDPELTGIPVVVLSADGNARQKALAMQAGAGLSKPVRLETLLSTVATYC